MVRNILEQISNVEDASTSGGQRNSDWYISISPDGKYILIFNHAIQKFKIIEFDNYEEIDNAILYDIEENLFKEYKSQKESMTSHYKQQNKKSFPKWMLAISNQVEYMNQKVIFVAISCVTELDMLVKAEPIELNNTLEPIAIQVDASIKNLSEIIKDKNQLNGKTVIYKMILSSSEQGKEKVLINVNNGKINKYKELNIGGVVSFVHDKSSSDKFTKIDCFIFNANGIHRLRFCDNHLDNLEHFDYPRRFIIELNTLYKSVPCISRIKNSVFGHYFHIEQYREGIQVMQLYDLRTMQIRQVFNIHEEKKYLNQYSKPILAISKNKQIIAFSSGYGKIALFLIENGLEIISKSFEKNTKIIACEFENNDKLMIIIKKSKSEYEEMLLWHLYNSSKNRFQSFCTNIKSESDEECNSYNVRIPGKFVTVRSNGSILSIYDSMLKIYKIKRNKSIQELNPYSIISTDKSKEGTPNKMNELEYENIHSVFHQDFSKKEAKPLIYNKEPWINDNFEKKWIYLDQKESIQLYIGKSTIQWKDDQHTQIQWPCDNNHVIPVKHACDALEYLYYQRNKLVGYDNQHVFEEIKFNISVIIWKFIKNYPDVWKLIDIRYNLMTRIIISGSYTLVKYILFGDEKVKNKYLHIPRINRFIVTEESSSEINNFNSKENIDISRLSDLQIAIRLCKPDLERNRRILIVTYLLEYYAINATDHPGWLITISNALPDLYVHKLEHLVSELFYKRCMEGIEISNILEYTDFIPKRYQITLNTKQNFFAFDPISDLISTSKKKINLKVLGDNLRIGLKKLYVKIFPNNYEYYSPTVKIVPLYKFTVNNLPQKIKNGYKSLFIIKLLRLIFIPRSYSITKNFSQLSPLVQIIRLENNNDIFNNPVMEAHILKQQDILANLVSISIAIVIMSIYVTPSFSTKNAFANISTTQEITVAISFTMLLLWFEFILYLRLLPEPAKYIYIMMNIIKETWIFLLFMILVIAGLAHSFLLLLQHPEFTNLSEMTSSFTLMTEGSVNWHIQKDFDRTKDNPAKNYITSFISTYNWLNGAFLQQDIWDFWAVKFITFFGCILLITILQNMLIAFMGGVYSEAYKKGRVGLLRFRAESISDYEALEEIYFYPKSPEPKYIYYLGESKSYKEWDSNVKKRETEQIKLYNAYEEKMIEDQLPSMEKDDDNESWWDYSQDDCQRFHF
ncbi:15274_t:CDS:10 [Funneliformis mosseae]|uniref:15274_t:CDS:1 n=1 Tax=Funneliformis mosseae TaxID=27381 RepID=A0A9N9GRL1_FUNMO|nr:15274_t:CDS:10 [Funneliformis mosseae]